jgi:aryl-alcohol dehydrogenase
MCARRASSWRASSGPRKSCGADEDDPVEAIKRASDGVGADFSIDATGSPDVLRQAVYCTGPGVVCGLIGAPPFGTEVALDMNEMLAVGRTLRGIVEGQSVPDVLLLRLIELWRQGRFPVDRIMTHYPFEEIDRAARDAEEGRLSSPCCGCQASRFYARFAIVRPTSRARAVVRRRRRAR